MSTIEQNKFNLEGELLKIHTYPSAILKKVAEPVTEFDAALKELCQNMLFTMYKAPGIGLAAPQIGVSKRIFVMDIDYKRDVEEFPDGREEYTLSNFNPRILINPKFIRKEGQQVYEEGCLSVPGMYEEVTRAAEVTVEFQDTDGHFHTLEAEGLLAVCLQHENDHLDGIVFIDRISFVKRNLIQKN